MAAAAEDAALRIANELGVTGVMAVELFETPGVGAGFLINELAMRPHNTGHWTQDGSVTSQFEQHLRAVLNLPLGATDLLGPVVVMKNFLGGDNQDLFSAYPAALASEPAAKVHCYGKSVRPGRKIGHVNLVGHLRRRRRLRPAAGHHRGRHHPGRPGSAGATPGNLRGERMSTDTPQRSTRTAGTGAAPDRRPRHGLGFGLARHGGRRRGPGRVRHPLRGRRRLRPPHAHRDDPLRADRP